MQGRKWHVCGSGRFLAARQCLSNPPQPSETPQRPLQPSAREATATASLATATAPTATGRRLVTHAPGLPSGWAASLFSSPSVCERIKQYLSHSHSISLSLCLSLSLSVYIYILYVYMYSKYTDIYLYMGSRLSRDVRLIFPQPSGLGRFVRFFVGGTLSFGFLAASDKPANHSFTAGGKTNTFSGQLSALLNR